MSIIRLNLLKKDDKKEVLKNNQTYEQLLIGL